MQELQESYQANPDGTGLVYYDTNLQKLVMHKWLLGTEFNTIWKYVSKLSGKKHIKNVAIHFRFATSAGKTIYQIHPIRVNKNMVLVHNGICSRFDLDPTVMSDTQAMGFWFKCLGHDLKTLKEKKFKVWLENTFAGNKLLLLEKDDYLIINSQLGEWKDDIWRSWKGSSLYGWTDYDVEPSVSGDGEQLKLFGFNDAE